MVLFSVAAMRIRRKRSASPLHGHIWPLISSLVSGAMAARTGNECNLQVGVLHASIAVLLVPPVGLGQLPCAHALQLNTTPLKDSCTSAG
jgi:hypothetical protein